MKNIPTKTKLVAASIGVLMAIVLTVGGTFAWLVLSRQPEVKKMNVNVSNSTVLEIAQAYPENYLTGPPEVGENDANKKRVVEGQTVPDQGVWGSIVDMTNDQIILQEPATFDEKTQTLSTVKFDRTGRTDGFQALIKQNIDEHGIVYFTKEVSDGNYRGEDGYIHTATTSMASPSEEPSGEANQSTEPEPTPLMALAPMMASATDESSPETSSEASPSEASPSSIYTPPTNVKCAGGIAIWMRSNKPTSEEVFLKGLSISKTTDDGKSTAEVTEDDILGVIVTTYHLKKSPEAKKLEKETGVPQQGELEPFNNYYAQKTEGGYVCTLFAGSSAQQMQPGELYLVEIICYIEGDMENGQGNTAAVAGNTGETKKVTFDNIECQDVLYAAKVTEENNTDRKNGWFAGPTKLKIELFGSSDQVDNKSIIIEYKITSQNDPDTVLQSDSFMAFDESGKKNSRTIEIGNGNALGDGIYELTVMTAQAGADGKVVEGATKYYTVSISDTSMVNTVEDSITVRVDTIRPTVTTKLSDCTCTYSEKDGTTYHNHDVTVIADATEENISNFRIGGRKITSATLSESDATYRAERLYSKAGDYTSTVVVTDRSGKSNEAGLTDITGKKTDEVHFIIDKTKPIVESLKWGFVNDSGIAQTLSKITGSAFFTKSVKLEAVAKDDYLLDMNLSDGTSTLDTNYIKDSDGKHITATAVLPLPYSGEIIITTRDKAGNVGTETTGPITISDKLPNTVETHTGTKASENAGSVVWYDITYHLSPDGDNADHVTGFEYSKDGVTWFDTDQKMSDVYYKVKKDKLAGDTVTIYCEDYTSVTDGYIYFRAVTDIIDDMDGYTKYLRGTPLVKTYNLEAVEPTIPVVSAKVNGKDYVAGTPVNGTILYTVSGGTCAELNVNHYEYSLDCVNWYSVNKIVNDVTYSVSGNKFEKITVEGADGKDTAAQIYFRAVSTKKADSSKSVNGAVTGAYKFEIDRKIPEISKPTWELVNYDAVSSILNSLTGNYFFNELLKVSATATDTNIQDFVCEGNETVQSKNEGNIVLNAYFNPEFSGEIVLTAKDSANNTIQCSTSPNELGVVKVAATTLDGKAYESGTPLYGGSVQYLLNIEGVSGASIDHFEYSPDGETWYSESTDVGNANVGYYERNGIKGRYLWINSNLGRHSKESLQFRAVVKTDSGALRYIYEGNEYAFEMYSVEINCVTKYYDEAGVEINNYVTRGSVGYYITAEAEDLIIDHFEHCYNDQHTSDTYHTESWTEDGMTCVVQKTTLPGDTLTVTGEEGKYLDGGLSTVTYCKVPTGEIRSCGGCMGAVYFRIDRKKPVIEEITTDDTYSIVSIKTSDDSLTTIDYSVDPGMEDYIELVENGTISKYGEKPIRMYAQLEKKPGFQGTIHFKVSDLAGNITEQDF